MRTARYLTGSNPLSGVSVVVADFNGDGVKDLIYPTNCQNEGSCSSSGFTLLLGDGSGGYKSPVIFTAPVQPQQTLNQFLAVGDFNGDGRSDVAVFNPCDASCSQTSISIFLNAGNGNFADPVIYEGVGATPLTVAIGDFNGDGKTDLALLAYCANGSCNGQWTIGILPGNGDGTFGSVIESPLDSGVVAGWMAAADVDGDGKTDLVITESNSSASLSDPYAEAAQVLLSNGDGTFRTAGVYSSGGDAQNGMSSVAIADVNGDNKADIVLGNVCDVRSGDTDCRRGSVGVLLGAAGDGSFIAGPIMTLSPGVNAYSISLADVNADGKLDAITATNSGIAVAFGNGDGSFQVPTVYVGASSLQNVQIAIADLDGNGSLDIVQPSSNQQQLAILYNAGSSTSASTTSLQSSVNPSAFGQTVTFVAMVTSSSGIATGTVDFTDNGTSMGSVSLAGGSATLSISDLGVGTHSIVAAYGGDPHNAASTSSTLQEVVNQASTTTSLTSSANPAYVNQTVTFKAVVASPSGAAISGTVTFKQGTATLATVNSTGNAPYTRTYTASGSHSITAFYSGDSDNAGSTSAVLLQLVDALPATTTTTMRTSRNPSYINQSVTFTAAVTSTYGPIPNGELITISDGTAKLASVPVSGGIATYTTSALKAATHTIKAAYLGDTTFKASSASVQQVVSLYPSSTTAPISSLNPSANGQSVTLTATVTSPAPSVPTGTVTFKNGTTSLGSVTLSANGVATLTKTTLPMGSLPITATYNGGAEAAKSTSAATTQTVTQAQVTLTLASTPNPSTLGKTVKFVASFTSTGGTPKGAVIFSSGTITLGTANISGGKATVSTSALPRGADLVTATYAGDADHSSANGSVTQVVN
jgi:hypothetical protein